MALYQHKNDSFFGLLSHLDPECYVDNTVLNSGTGGDTIASDDIAGIKHQRVKISVGADGAASDAVPVSNGMDVTGTAVQAVGLVGQLDDTATGAVTENQFAPVRISTRRALLVEGVASGTSVPVSAASLPLPTSAATEATVSALAGDVGDTADAAATAGSTGTLHAKQRLMTSQLDSIKTAVETLDNAIAGSEMQVDVVAALPAGANNIGDIDVLTTVMPANRTASGALGALNNAVTINSQGARGISWEIDTGTLVGTVSFEATLDDTAWFAINAVRIDGTLIGSTTTFADRGSLTSVAYSQVRMRVSAFTSGTSNGRMAASGGGEVVRVGQALPAGTNAIGKLAANSGVDIGDVDILSIAAGDNNIGNVDVVTLPALPTGANTIGTVNIGTFPDNEPFNVSQINGVTPLMGNGITGTGSQRVTVASDNTAFSVNPLSATAPVSTMNSASANSGVNSAMAAVFDDTAPTAITENSFGFLRMSANRNLFGTIRDAAGNERGANVTAGNALVVDGSAATQPVSGTVSITANSAVNVAQINGVTPLMGNGVTGTGSQRVTVASDNTAFTVNVGTFPDNEPFNVAQINGVTPLMGAGNTGTGSQRVTIASDQAVIAVGGNVAHSGVDAGNPIKIGGLANANEQTAVADADRVDAWFDPIGRQVCLLGHASPEAPVTANGSAAGVSVIAAPGASLSLYICKGSLHNSAAAEAIVSLRDGAAGTIRFTANLAADGGGCLFDFGSRGWKLTANTAFVMDAASATQYCNVTEYYIAA